MFAGFEHSKSNVNELAHGGANNFHFVFAAVSQALTKSADNRVVSFGDQRWEKERLTHSGVAGL